MFLQACLNGSRPPGDHDRLPLTPDELARDAAEVAAAGAVALHVHPRGSDGLESLEPEHCGAAVAALREAAPKLEISLSTGLWITDGDVERRLECVRGWTELPDCVSVNVIEEGWEELAALLRERGIEIEIGLWLAEHPDRLRGHLRAARRAPRGLECGARRRGRGALHQAIRLTASSAATL
ncbi:MAG: 3-keto-5-aminohexanoate cleavage protein [Solirubrobacteraceae bacterium]